MHDLWNVTAASAKIPAVSVWIAVIVFAAMVAALGGPSDLLENPDTHLAEAPFLREVRIRDEGFVTAVDTRALGVAVVALGGGRTRVQDPVDPAVGLSDQRACSFGKTGERRRSP